MAYSTSNNSNNLNNSLDEISKDSLVNIQIDPIPEGYVTQENSTTYDNNLLNSFTPSTIQTYFDDFCYIELSIHNNTPNKEIIFIDYNLKSFKSTTLGNEGNINSIQLNTTQDLNKIIAGVSSGRFTLNYGFYRRIIGSNNKTLYISEISSDRTELRLSSLFISPQSFSNNIQNFQTRRASSEYFIDFYLNFGNAALINAVNILTDNLDTTTPSILIKLPEPLPSNYKINDTLWLVEKLSPNQTFLGVVTPKPIEVKDSTPIQGPNLNLDIKNELNNTSTLQSLDELLLNPTTSSLDRINSLLNEKSININIDYSNFSNFIHFSSTQTRINNFQYKIGLLESYSSSLNSLNLSTPSTNISSSKATYNGKIKNIINNFDGYERYLYYESGSYSYPKTTSQIPYTLAKSDSTIVTNWLGNGDVDSNSYGGILSSASLYDIDNRNQLFKSIPEYLRTDPNNQQYELFVDMVAQYYDNIWIYLKDITNKYNNDNRLNFGISKDLVADAIRDFGTKLYQNNFSNNDLYTAFLGLTPNGGLFPYPNMTSSLPTPTGFEYVDTLVSASNDITTQDDVNKSLYKRIYHNLPYLLNTKGTIPGLRALITSYGIPDTILRINEYGGKDKVDVNDWDHWQNEFNYAFFTTGSNFISSSWHINDNWYDLGSGYVPETVEFRFKTNGLPKSNIPVSQSLWYLSGSGGNSAVTLRYEGTAYTSASYDGSIKDPKYQYAYLDFYPLTSLPNQTASVYLPFFDGGWWSVAIQRDNAFNNQWTLKAANQIYNGGENNTSIGFISSSTVNFTSSLDGWRRSNNISYFPSPINILTNYTPFSGSYQEIRYFRPQISESVFRDYTMNPYSIEGNSINSSPNDLIFRASLGGELYTGSNSIHPKVTGSWAATQSFSGSNNGFSNFNFNSTPTFLPNHEYFFVDQPIAGIKNVIGDKIRFENNVVPSGDVLSPIKSVLQQTNISQSYTPNINYLEVAFSPQNQINEDIMSQIGFFNIGDYIGDPRLRSSSADTYPSLDKLRDEYFQKYIKNYDLKDFIRLIKFFDNSLFKMIKDFVPARTSLASGLVIKQHLLERNKYPQPQLKTKTPVAKTPNDQLLIFQNLLLSGSVLPQSRNYNSGSIIKTSGGTGGTFEQFNNLNTSPYGTSGLGPTNRYSLTQSYNEIINTVSGSAVTVISNQDEFYDGEFKGSQIIVTTQSLAASYPDVYTDMKYSSILYANDFYNLNFTSSFTEGHFLDGNTTPSEGEILYLAPFEYEVSSFPPSKFNTLSTNPYIKIHKIDCDGSNNDVILSQITKMAVKHFGKSSYTFYTVKAITEHPTYFQFKLAIGDIGSLSSQFQGTSEIKNYFVSSSITSSIAYGGGFTHRIDPFQFELGNIAHYGTKYFNTSSGIFTLGDTPNIPLQVTASFHTDGNKASTFTGSLNFVRNRQGTNTIISSFDYFVSQPSFNTFTEEILPLKDDQYFFEMTKPDVTGYGIFVRSASLLITQSDDPVSKNCVDTFVEPYIALNNYYNSDFNPTINNVMDNRKSTIYQNIDYSNGLLIPINFGLLMSGSALKFPIRDSHYTQLSSIIPRYLGAKTTSQFLNKWTEGDLGTYGKEPTAQSLKSLVVYSDWIGGYPPEHMDASGVHVQYIINQDGTIKIPNTSENSLEDLQQTFETNNKLILNSTTIGTGQPTPLRDIIKGGYRIEPILYTQFGHSPAQFNVTMSFIGNYVSSATTTDDYTLLQAPTSSLPLIFNQSIIVPMSDTISSGSGTTLSSGNYQTNQAQLVENITLNVEAILQPRILPTSNPSEDPTQNKYILLIELIRLHSGNETTLDSVFIDNETSPGQYAQTFTWDATPNYPRQGSAGGGYIRLVGSLSPQHYGSNDQIYVKTQLISPNTALTGTVVLASSGAPATSLRITQDPIPTANSTITSSGVNTLWGYPNNTQTFAITASNQGLINYYGSGFKMDNTRGMATGSGFGTIDLPWSLEIGDEFRFEGNENNVFMVKKVYTQTDTDLDRISSTGSIEIHFDNSLPSSSINLDNFLIRRYVPDASQIIIKGFKPINSVGPYIARPEYVTSELIKGIDDYILDLTDKDLI
tara:strand:+ start:1797 stop:8027 length:6231 start_codon:yes stop_codon:yes gene_type:complete